MSQEAALIVSFGGPVKREEIRPFLANVVRGRPVPPERLEEVAHHYEAIAEAIGEPSPLNRLTFQQAEDLRRELIAQGHPLPVYVGMRNWKPYLADTLKKMAHDGVHRAVGFVTAAHRCEASWDRYLRSVAEGQGSLGPQAPQIEYVDPWFEAPLFIEAITEQVTNALSALPGDRASKAVWIFAAHSVPVRMAQASRYAEEIACTAERVCQRLGKKDWTVAYQSRSGSPQEPWLEPDILDVLKDCAAQGVRDVLVIPIGFLVDHVEILYDLDIEAQRAAREAGLALTRVRTVGAHPRFIQMMASAILAKVNSSPPLKTCR